LFGLTGLGDRTVLSVFSTSDFHEQQTVQLGHDFRLGSQGLSVSGLFTYAWARPSVEGGDDDIDARTLFGTLEVAYPFVRRQALGVRGSVGLDYVNQDVDIDHIDLTRDRLRVGFARVGLDLTDPDFSRVGYSYAEPMWRLTSLLELRQGMHILGATHDCRRAVSKAAPMRRCCATRAMASSGPCPRSPWRSARARNMRGSRC
jgi:hemolysin activation/secretion protein